MRLRTAYPGITMDLIGLGVAGCLIGCHPGLRDPKAPVKEDLLASFPAQPPRVGERAPGFTAVDLHGAPHTLTDYLGDKPVVLDFANYT